MPAVLFALGAGIQPAQSRDSAAATSGAAARPVKNRRAREPVTVYWVPRPERPRRAIVDSGAVFSIKGKPQPGDGCNLGWAEVAGGGYACLDQTEPVSEEPTPVPALIDDVVPFTYVYRKGDPGYKLAYDPVPDAKEGDANLIRRGKPLNAEVYDFHQPSRFRGRDLEKSPPPTGGLVVGWAVLPQTPVYKKPGDSKPVAHLDLHTELSVNPRPEKGAGGTWHQVRKAGQSKVLGFMDEKQGLRYWQDVAAVNGVADNEIWIDVDLAQQVVALRQGNRKLVYLTLISAGIAERPTPLGIFRITHKHAYRTMGALPDSPDPYFIENVPWIMYFRPHYALHGAYWHDEFGNERSHGCVNLAPLDAAYIYQRVAPHQQPSFFTTFGSDRAPGAIVRIRTGTNIDVPDERDTTS